MHFYSFQKIIAIQRVKGHLYKTSGCIFLWAVCFGNADGAASANFISSSFGSTKNAIKLVWWVRGNQGRWQVTTCSFDLAGTFSVDSPLDRVLSVWPLVSFLKSPRRSSNRGAAYHLVIRPCLPAG